MITIVDEATRGYALGSSDYLTKPVDQERLLAVVKRHAGAGSRPAVLLVEDDDATRELVRLKLEEAGCRVVQASNGRRALDRLEEVVPDLVLLDLMMPEMDGFDFLQALRANPAWHKVRVVILTARELSVDDHVRLNGKVHQILQRSAVTGRELLEEIRTLISGTVARDDEQPAASGPRILYVEDNEDNIVLLKSRLEEEGFEVIVALDGEQGVALARSEVPALILMDMALPKLDGWTATRILKSSEATEGIPIIGLSTHAMVGDREKALATGCDDYFTKPVDQRLLVRRLHQLLAQDTGERHDRAQAVGG